MAEVRVYRTYRWMSNEKDPVIDRVRTLIQDEGLFKDLGAVHEISGVSRAALDGWFFGDTRQPRHATVEAVVTSLGYETTFQKKKDIDVEKERNAGKVWLQNRAKEREKMNGRKAKKGK